MSANGSTLGGGSLARRLPWAKPKSSSALISGFTSYGPSIFFARAHGIRIRPDQERVYPEFLNLYLNSPVGQEAVQAQSRTTSGLRSLSVGFTERQLAYVGR